MRIKVPDDDEVFARVESNVDSQQTEQKTPFQDEIKELMKLPKLRSSFIVNKVELADTPEGRLQVLSNFTKFCRDEVFPRHTKAYNIIQSRSNGLDCQLAGQQLEITRMISCGGSLRQYMHKIEAKQTQAQEKQQELIIRLRHSLGVLRACCKNKTAGEEKTAQNLKCLDKKVGSLKIQLQELKLKSSSYSSQVKVQSESVRKYIKPLYLDKNRTVFLRSSLNTMRENMEDVIHRLKVLNNMVSEVSDHNESHQAVDSYYQSNYVA